MPDLKVRVGGAWQSVTTTGPQGPPGPAGSGAPAAHKTTHETGGTDQITGTLTLTAVTASGAVNAASSILSGANTFGGATLTVNGHSGYGTKITLGSGDAVNIVQGTADGADTGSTYLAGGGYTSSDRGSCVIVRGNEHGIQPGQLYLSMGDAAQANIVFGHSGGTFGTMYRSGGFAWGGNGGPDPGAGNFSVAGDVVLTAALPLIRLGTPDGADTGRLSFMGGGSLGEMRGASVSVFGNEFSIPSLAGGVSMLAGDVAGGGAIQFYTGAAVLRGQIHRSGGFSWGSTTDPGAGTFTVGPGAPFTPGQTFVTLTPGGSVAIGHGATAATNVVFFYTPSGFAGSIQTANATTSYLSTSDARLKTDRGRHTDPEVLRRTVIHDFVWKSDGQPGRGVFAQEAVEVAPFAVSVGTDEVNEQGLLAKPWGVDYSKYVPDLVVGWQAHDAKIAALEAKIAKLEAMIEKLLT